MDKKLLISALVKVVAGILLVGALLFVPAGAFDWWQAWLLMGILFIPMIIAGFFMLAKAPDLLRKRLDAREEEDEQRTVIALSGLMFVAAFVVAGLGYRFGWMTFPIWVTWLGAALFLASYALYGVVISENKFLSRTIEVQEGQHVVDTGLYGIVRHPMYSSTLVLFLSMPLVLGSPFAFIIMLVYIPIIVKRILNEEKVLAEGLEGYADYLARVPWRLIPHVW